MTPISGGSFPLSSRVLRAVSAYLANSQALCWQAVKQSYIPATLLGDGDETSMLNRP
jgi:hypothetical protein